MKLTKQFEQFALKNNLGHAYLLYNVDYLDIEEELKYIIFKYFFCSENKQEFNDLKFITPNNSIIIKEQILDLKKSFKTYSQVNQNKVYIINECEKMNQAAANSLLKFLEEPEKNIYAFLISKDLNKVLPTISSRCIKIFLKNKENEILDNDLEITLILLKALINKKYEDNINKIYAIMKNLTREKINEILDSMILVLKKFLDVNLGVTAPFEDNELKNILLNNLTNEDIIKKVLFLNDIKESLEYNINIQMFIDKLVIDW